MISSLRMKSALKQKKKSCWMTRENIVLFISICIMHNNKSLIFFGIKLDNNSSKYFD